MTREDVSEARELGTDPVTRQADLGALRQVRSVRADRHQGRRGEAEVREPAADISAWTALTLPEALELFKLPRTIGNMPDGHAIRVAIGRFGPYVQYGAKKFVSIKDDDPYTLELPRALELIKRRKSWTRIASSSISPTPASRC